MLTDRNIFQNELRDNERILWTGRPQQGIHLHWRDLLEIPICGYLLVMLGGIVVNMWAFGAWMLPFAIPFVLFAGYTFLEPILFAPWQRSKTEYAVTNQRALIRSGILTRKVRSINLLNRSEVTLDLKTKGRGNIVFGKRLYRLLVYAPSSWTRSKRYDYPFFDHIENAGTVYKLILDEAIR